ncbi:MAG: hypothetical protein WC967_13435 [Balneolaceae bacterium]
MNNTTKTFEYPVYQEMIELFRNASSEGQCLIVYNTIEGSSLTGEILLKPSEVFEFCLNVAEIFTIYYFYVVEGQLYTNVYNWV